MRKVEPQNGQTGCNRGTAQRPVTVQYFSHLVDGAVRPVHCAAMRIYEGAPRQDYEEVLRSIGALLDQRGMREVLLAETAEGYLVQGLAPHGGESGAWTDPAARIEKESFNFVDEDLGRFMEEGLSRRATGTPADAYSNFYERALRVLGRWIDEQKPSDVFFFEQEHAFVVRLLLPRAGARHTLAEFTREEIEAMIESGPSLREPAPEGSPTA